MEIACVTTYENADYKTVVNFTLPGSNVDHSPAKLRMHRNRAGKKMDTSQCVRPVIFWMNCYNPFNVTSFLQ